VSRNVEDRDPVPIAMLLSFTDRRLALLLALAALLVAATAAAAARHPVTASGVSVRVPPDWIRISLGRQSGAPRRILVVGTAGVRPVLTARCRLAAYRIPIGGAAVVITAQWAKGRPGGVENGIALRRLRLGLGRLRCYSQLGGFVTLHLGTRRFQVAVMVDRRAGIGRIADAIAVARSFMLVRSGR